MVAREMKNHLNEQQCILVEYHKRIVVFFRCREEKAKIQMNDLYLDKILNSDQVVLGVSDWITRSNYLFYAYQQANIASNYGKPGEAIYFWSVRYRFVTDAVSEKIHLRVICHPVIFEIYQYDLLHKSRYIETLTAFYDCGQKVSLACKQLFIHRNTMVYRLERIRELWGEAILEEDISEIVLSLKLVQNLMRQ